MEDFQPVFHRNVPRVNLYRVSSRNFDHLQSMGFEGGAYFLYVAHNDALRVFSSNKFHMNFPWVNLKLYSKDIILTHEQQTAFENIVEKEELAGNEQFLLFPHCFLLNQIPVSLFVHILTPYLHLLLNWKSPKLAYEEKG